MVNSFFRESVTDYSGKPLPGKNLPLGRFHGEAISKLNPAWRPSLLPSPWDFPHLPPARVYTCFVAYSRGAHGQPPAAWGPCPKEPLPPGSVHSSPCHPSSTAPEVPIWAGHSGSTAPQGPGFALCPASSSPSCIFRVPGPLSHGVSGAHRSLWHAVTD